MTKFHRLPAFTLVEILVSVVIFTGVMGALFSALSAMQRTDLFRRDNVALAQAADYAFEPLVQRLKEADAKETVSTENGCVTVQGYYVVNKAGKAVEAPLLNGKVYELDSGTNSLVVITAEKNFNDEGIGAAKTWVRRDYYVQSKQVGGTTVKTLMEKTYTAAKPTYDWPAPLRSSATTCESPSVHWDEVTNGEKELTGSKVSVDAFAISLIAATVPPTNDKDADIEQRAPFITLSLTVSKPNSKVAQPVTLRTTLTPTFSYGETRED